VLYKSGKRKKNNTGRLSQFWRWLGYEKKERKVTHINGAKRVFTRFAPYEVFIGVRRGGADGSRLPRDSALLQGAWRRKHIA